MEKYLFSRQSLPEIPKQCNLRGRWKRSVIELNGRLEPKYCHDQSFLLMQSYSEIGAFPHLYHIRGCETPCLTHMNQFVDGAFLSRQWLLKKHGISALDCDSKGIYLVSVTRSGCLTVHDFETLYYHCNENLSGLKEDESKHLLHISLELQLDAVRWNPANQDEVACASRKLDEVRIFDVGYISFEPVEVLRIRRALNVLGYNVQKGLSDIAFTATEESRLIASDTQGVLNVWDRRVGILPCLELSTGSHSTLNSIQLHADNQIIFAAGKHGTIYMWDLRGGRTSVPFRSHKEVCHSPLAATKLVSMLQNIGTLKAQSSIVPQEIHSIDLDPS